MKISPQTYRSEDWRAHSVLENVELLDVWRIDLPAEGSPESVPRTLELLEQFTARSLQRMGPLVRGLFKLRAWVGAVFGWDTDPAVRQTRPLERESFVHRVPSDLRWESLREPGSFHESMRLVYITEDEVLFEAIDATCQSAVHVAIAPTESEGSETWALQLTVAVYVVRTRWWTGLYLAAIAPFRHLLIYPALLRFIRSRWIETRESPPAGSLMGR